MKLNPLVVRPVVAGSLLSLGLVALTQQVQAAEKKPNVILIMTDQQTASAMSCAGNPNLSTPAMDALAADGVLFSRAYCPYPLSGPCRASLLTGQMPFEVGATANGVRPAAEKMATHIGYRMAEAGYDCLYAGKWHVPEVDIPENAGFTKVCNMNDPALVDACANALQKRGEKPIFLVASFLDPHEICEYARNETMPYGPLQTTFTTADCPNLPANFRPSTYEAEAIRLAFAAEPRTYPTGNYTQDEWRQYIYTYYRLIERVDHQIGRLVQLLKQRGLYDQSVILFCSDHGDGVAAHGWNQKWVLFEEVINVPLILKAPKGAGVKGIKNQTALSNIGLDIYTTFCDYAGISLDPKRYRGQSLRPIVEGLRTTLHEEVFVETLFSGTQVRGWSIVENRYKYVLYNYHRDREQLYDLLTDKGEMLNLAVDVKYATELARLRKKMYEWGLKINDSRLIRNLRPLVENKQQNR
ncbi:MAG: sulfatase-like hydrolase/transferase [Alistipes sp.]